MNYSLSDCGISNTFENIQEPHTITADFLPVTGVPPAPPIIAAFSASPSSIPSGGSASLNWEVLNASEVLVSPGDYKSSKLSGTLNVSPSSTTTYTLSALNAITYATSRTTVQVVTAPVLTNVVASVSNIVKVTRNTDQSAKGQVRYGMTQTSLNSYSQMESTYQRSHKIALTNLMRRTRYYYQALSTNAAGQTGFSPVYSFVTK